MAAELRFAKSHEWIRPEEGGLATVGISKYAVEALTDRELELRKRALYRAGVLAAGLKDLDAAQKHLSAVAGLDYGYRDVAQRLDKLRSTKHNGDVEG